MQANYKNATDPIPLLLCDIKRAFLLEGENLFDLKFPNRKITFKFVMVHARVVQKLGIINQYYYKYTLDDGTACVEMSVFKQTERLQQLDHLENEVASKKHKLADSLNNLLKHSKKFLDYSNIPINSKVLIYGRLNVYNDIRSIQAFNIVLDDGLVRQMEIKFKDYLIDFYKKYC